MRLTGGLPLVQFSATAVKEQKNNDINAIQLNVAIMQVAEILQEIGIKNEFLDQSHVESMKKKRGQRVKTLAQLKLDAENTLDSELLFKITQLNKAGFDNYTNKEKDALYDFYKGLLINATLAKKELSSKLTKEWLSVDDVLDVLNKGRSKEKITREELLNVAAQDQWAKIEENLGIQEGNSQHAKALRKSLTTLGALYGL